MMTRGLLALGLGGSMLAGAVALAKGVEQAGDRSAGRQLAGQCRTCHGLDGYARIPIAPHIGGEPAVYLAAQLQAFRDGTRQHEMMTVVAAGLSDAQIDDLAAWYAGHVALAAPPAPEAAPEGCIDCHGIDGLAQVSDAPNLAGESALYIDTQLKAFKRGKRRHEVMSAIAESLDDTEIRALADYYAAIGLTITRVD